LEGSFYLFSVATIFCTTLAYYVSKKRGINSNFFIISPFFSVFCAIALASFGRWGINLQYEFTVFEDRDYWELTVLSSVWLVFYTIGYMFGLFGSCKKNISSRPKNVGNNFGIIFLFSLITLIVYLYASQLFHLVDYLSFSEFRRAHLSSVIGNGYISLVFYLQVSFTAVVLFNSQKNHQKILAFLLTLAPNILLTNRLNVLTLFFLAAIAMLMSRKRVSILKQLVALGIAAVFLAYMGIARNSNFEFRKLIELFVASFDQVEGLYHALQIDSSPLFGKSILEDILITYVPRSIWTEKPVLYGATLAQSIVFPKLSSSEGLQMATYPIGALAEGYLNFKYFGVMATGFIIGLFQSFFWRWLFISRLNFLNLKNLIFLNCMILSLVPLNVLRSFGSYISAIIVFCPIVAILQFAAIFFLKEIVFSNTSNKISRSNKVPVI
jgi:hypothetical protein